MANPNPIDTGSPRPASRGSRTNMMSADNPFSFGGGSGNASPRTERPLSARGPRRDLSSNAEKDWAAQEAALRAKVEKRSQQDERIKTMTNPSEFKATKQIEQKAALESQLQMQREAKASERVRAEQQAAIDQKAKFSDTSLKAEADRRTLERREMAKRNMEENKKMAAAKAASPRVSSKPGWA